VRIAPPDALAAMVCEILVISGDPAIAPSGGGTDLDGSFYCGDRRVV